MLKNILSPETCRECRLCCVFDRTDIWELPVLSKENVCAAEKVCPGTAVTEKGSEYVFSAPELQDEELFWCPVLSDRGCMLCREDMPFDCRIWPFRLMRDGDGNTVIAVSELCGGMADKTDEELREFLGGGLGDIIFSFGKEHPDHVKPFAGGYRVIV